MAIDFRNVLTAEGVDAVYTPKGTTLALPVKVLVAPDVQRPDVNMPSVALQQVKGLRSTAFVVQVPSLLTGEVIDTNNASVMGQQGGVVELKVGDSFTIDGEHVNRASGTSYTIKIANGVERHPGRWVGVGAL
jgi:hypothetical protein